jgi:uncharacterized membrane protein
VTEPQVPRLTSVADLQLLETFLPGGAARALKMAEEQQRHTHELNRADLRSEQLGRLSGLVVSMAFLATSAWLIDGGHELAGTVIGTVDLVALATVFVVGRPRS